MHPARAQRAHALLERGGTDRVVDHGRPRRSARARVAEAFVANRLVRPGSARQLRFVLGRRRGDHRPPRALIICVSSSPTPPAAACTTRRPPHRVGRLAQVVPVIPRIAAAACSAVSHPGVGTAPSAAPRPAPRAPRRRRPRDPVALGEPAGAVITVPRPLGAHDQRQRARRYMRPALALVHVPVVDADRLDADDELAVLASGPARRVARARPGRRVQ